jgi:hypothetical protein
MTATTLPAGQIDVAGVPTALIDTGDPGGFWPASRRPRCCCCTDQGRA